MQTLHAVIRLSITNTGFKVIIQPVTMVTGANRPVSGVLTVM